MLALVLGLILFLGIHCISIVAEPLRNRAVAISEIGWSYFMRWSLYWGCG